ncbi:glycosyltransferase family 9 protein [Yeosuana sp. AK3]
MPKKDTNILVIRLSAMGDVAMTIPVLRALLDQHPELKITVLSKEFFKPFFRDLKNVSFVAAQVKDQHKGVLGLYKLANQLNKENKFFAVADLHHVLRSRILKKFLKYKRFASIDKGRSIKEALISGVIFEPLKTTHQRYAEVFEKLGFPINLSNAKFPENAILSEKIEGIVGNGNRKVVGIAPFAAHESKMYPLDLMKQVIGALEKEYSILLFGGGSKEITILNDFESAFNHVKNLAGKLSLDEELDIISNLDVMLSMDSGNAHIAAMLGVKVVTIWGVTHPYAGFAPFNQPSDYALLSDREKFYKIPTSVYGNKYPEDYKEASRSISPEIVIQKIKSII